MTPFTAKQFFDVFTAYNEAVWPAPVLLLLGALVLAYTAAQPSRLGAGGVAAALGLLWIWTGAVYHLAFFTTIDPLAWLFGGAFLLQGVLLAAAGARHAITFGTGDDGAWGGGGARAVVGAIFVAYALVGYPWVGHLTGHAYPATPTFGAPCPTTIFTFGVLLWARGRVPPALLVVPALWSVIGTTAVVAFGVVQDAALIVAGGVGTVMILAGNRSVRLRMAARRAAGPPSETGHDEDGRERAHRATGSTGAPGGGIL